MRRRRFGPDSTVARRAALLRLSANITALSQPARAVVFDRLTCRRGRVEVKPTTVAPRTPTLSGAYGSTDAGRRTGDDRDALGVCLSHGRPEPLENSCD